MDQTKAFLYALLGCMACGAAVAVGAMLNGTPVVSAVLLGAGFAAQPLIIALAIAVIIAVIIIFILMIA
jgi:hypothetical protein